MDDEEMVRDVCELIMENIDYKVLLARHTTELGRSIQKKGSPLKWYSINGLKQLKHYYPHSIILQPWRNERSEINSSHFCVCSKTRHNGVSFWDR